MKSKGLHIRNRLQKAMPTILILLTWAMTACHKQTYHHSYQPVNSTGWHKNDTLIYTLTTPLVPEQTYELEVGIRHKDSYRYRDIWLTAEKDTLHFHLADSIGNWVGNGIGNLRHHMFHTTFNVTGDTMREIRITHIMQHNPLPDIDHIGIRIYEKH